MPDDDTLHSKLADYEVDLLVEIDLNESDVAKVFLNQECRVSPEAYSEKKYRGFVAEMAPEANRQKGTLQVKVQIRDPDKFLTPELTATVEFLPREP
jgi:HlyD family secretion protein